jgi:hypothetical protein
LIDQRLAAPHRCAGRFDFYFAGAGDAEGHQQAIR